jgi:hypothetical protein
MKITDHPEYKEAFEQTLIAFAAGVEEIEILDQLEYWAERDKFEMCLGMETAIAQFKLYQGYARIKNVYKKPN